MRHRAKIGRAAFIVYVAGVCAVAGYYFYRVRAENPIRFYANPFLFDPGQRYLGPLQSRRPSAILDASDLTVERDLRTIMGKKDGKVIWRYSITKSKPLSPIYLGVVPKVVLIGTGDGALVSLARYSGELMWSYAFKGTQVEWNATLNESNDDLLLSVEYYEQNLGFLLLVDQKSGEEKWHSAYFSLDRLSHRRLVFCGAWAVIQATDYGVIAFDLKGSESHKDFSLNSKVTDIACDSRVLTLKTFDSKQVRHDL